MNQKYATQNFDNLIKDFSEYINKIPNKPAEYLKEKQSAIFLLDMIKRGNIKLKSILIIIRNELKFPKNATPHEENKTKLEVWNEIYKIFKKYINNVF